MTSKIQKPKVCFCCEKIHPLLDGNMPKRFAGGAELQQVLIAGALLRLGYEVSFVTMDYGQGKMASINGFKVFGTYRFHEGLPIVRFFYPKLIKIWKALRRANADIYYLRGAAFELTPIVLYSRRNGKRAVFCSADNRDFDPNEVPLGNIRDKVMFYWGLRRCDAIVAQNEFQRRLLLENFSRRAQLIYNGYPPDSSMANTSHGHILWVANFSRLKNPKKFLELARRVPTGRFIMIGGSMIGSSGDERRRQKSVERDAASLRNLTYKGFLPLDEVEEEFRHARLFVNTSTHEGFPNTFLQAWRSGVPVVSFVDPDHLIEKYGLGIVVKDLDEMAQKVAEILENKIQFAPERIKAFFNANLTIDQVAKKYDELFTSLAG